MAKKAVKLNKPAANKTQQILGLLQRPNGTSIPELIKATEWQAHSVRGFLAGTVRKRMGLDCYQQPRGRQGPPLSHRRSRVMARQMQHGIGKAAPDTDVGRQLLPQIHLLQELSIAELKSQWTELIGSEPPWHAKRSFLTQTIAWELQAKTIGKLKPGIHRQLLQAGRGGRDAKPVLSELESQTLRPGVKLIRVWKGVTHHVLVTEDGFLWQYRSWRSLSVIARKIAGTPWSGPVFFGLKKSKTYRGRICSAPGVEDGIGDHSLDVEKVLSHGQSSQDHPLRHLHP